MNLEQENTTEKPPKNTVEILLNEKLIHLVTVDNIEFSDMAENEMVEAATEPMVDADGQEIRMAVQVDRYNQSEIVEIDGQKVIFIREEARVGEDTVVKIFRLNEQSGKWDPVDDVEPLVGYQDPSYMGEVRGSKLLYTNNTRKEMINGKEEIVFWPEVFKINHLNELECIAKGPEKMKGVRLIETSDGKIRVFARPQGEEFGKGKICYFEIDDLSQLEDRLNNINEAEIIDIFDDNEWGGVNDLHELSDGRIGVLGHIAREIEITGVLDEKGNKKYKKEYYVTASIFDPETHKISELKIIMTRADLCDKEGNQIQCAAKRPELENVIYPTNSVLEGDKLIIYAGIGDTKAIVFTVENPWKNI